MPSFDELFATEGNEAETTPVDTEASVDTNSPANETSTQVETTPVNQEEELPQSIKDLLAQNPEAKSIVDLVNKEMKGAWTPKLQEAAEAKKLIEGLDSSQIDILRWINNTYQSDPAAVVNWFKQQADQLAQNAGNFYQETPPANPQFDPNDPLSSYVPQTEAEVLMLNELRAQKEWRLQQEAQSQQIQLQAKTQHVISEFDRIQKEYPNLGTIPMEVKAQAWEIADKTGLSIEDAFFAVKRKDILPSLLQAAETKGASFVQQKVQQSAGNPQGKVDRAETPEVKPRTFDDYFNMEKANSAG